MITKRDLEIEKLLREMSEKPLPKNAKHTVRFDRDIFYYNKDELARQTRLAERVEGVKVTYEDHVKVVKEARFMLGKETQAEIAMAILSHRWFKNYRAAAFKGTGSFREDFSFVLSKIGNIVDHRTSKIVPPEVKGKLEAFTKPTLVQVNHLAGTVEVITPPAVLTLQEWAVKFNAEASEANTYIVAGRKI